MYDLWILALPSFILDLLEIAERILIQYSLVASSPVGEMGINDLC
jgi:hypothetical protein